ncbi:hypothetical protein LJC34_02560 [Oscillospiraceae bacterium OttesenSCG-928-G22]|nr:hypothetical protein [Oscillospiraceae bacterium OttesenSCG-928-G22]
MGLVHGQIGPASNYYVFNGHGDMTGLADSSGTITKTYDYDAFGVERDIDGLDVNPFRYSGEYFDRETGEIYLRARYYSPGIGRFTTEDSVKSAPKVFDNGQTTVDSLSLNLYTYCYNNPIAYVDPSGNYIVVIGTDDYKNQVLDYLRELTSLSFSMDDKGKVLINEAYTPLDSRTPQSDHLVRTLIASDKKVEIKYKEGKANAVPGFFGSYYIKLDPNVTDTDVYVQYDDGSVKVERIPMFIALGHEMTHVYNWLNGKNDTSPMYYSVETSIGTITNINTGTYFAEEIYTTGIPGYEQLDRRITENVLRREHGLPTRISYGKVDVI